MTTRIKGNKTNDKEPSHNPLEPLPVVRALFLAFINLHPNSTGYDLMGQISRFTEGLIELKSGTVYSELRRLEKQGYVHSTQEKEGRRRRSYTITATGKEELEQLAQLMHVRVKSILMPLLSLIER